MSKHVKVKRAFCISGERQEVGKVLEVGDAFAMELVSVGKAEYTQAPSKAPREEKAPAKDESPQKAAAPQKGAK